jgi:hypothetical protein
METRNMEKNPIEQLAALEGESAEIVVASDVQHVPTRAESSQDETFSTIRDVILVEKLGLPGDSMSEAALIDAVMANLAGARRNEERLDGEVSTEERWRTRLLAAEALDVLTDERLLARIETLVVLRPDAASTERPGRPSSRGSTPDDVRAMFNEEFLALGPGESMDRGEAFSRTNHAFNCEACAHDPAQLKEFAVVFDEALDDLIEDGCLAEIVWYVRLPDAEKCESVSA